MKKRYLAMLMAVVMCLSFGITGAMAVEETASDAPVAEEVLTETSSTAEQEAEEAPAEEVPAEQAAAADVPTPVTLSDDAVPLDGGYSDYGTGVAIEGFGGTVVYGVFMSINPDAGVQWKSSEPVGVTSNFNKQGQYPDYKVGLEVGSSTAAGEYTFDVSVPGSGPLPGGTLKVYSLEDAIENGKIVTSSGFKLKLEGVPSEPEASSVPLSDAKFGLYTANPSDDETAEPVATFTTNEDGVAEIKLDLEDVDAEALPPIGDPTASDEGAKGGKTYYLKQLTTAEGWYCPTTVREVWGYAQWDTDSDNFGATTKLNFVLEKPGNPNNAFFFVRNYKPTYEGFDLYAWTADDDYSDIMLSGVEFSVCKYDENETDPRNCEELATFTTYENGKVTIDPADFGLTWTDGEEKTFCLFQTRASDDAEHGERPIPEEVWLFNAAAMASPDGSQLTVSLTTPTNDGHGWADEDGSFWVYNDRWVSMSVDVEKTVVVKNEGMDPGKNPFDFLLVYDFSDNETQFPSLFFTPEGGEPVALDNETLYSEADEDDGNYYCKLAAAFSMTVQGADTVKGTVTIEGWESVIKNIGSTELYEMGDDTDDWTLEDYKYDLGIGRFDDPVHGVILLKPEFTLSRTPQLDAVPSVGEDDDIICNDDGKYFAVRGNNGRWYGFDTAEDAESVEFVNTYTKAAPVQPTNKPAHSPRTGDEANLALWIGLAAVGVCGLAAAVVVLKKKKAK